MNNEENLKAKLAKAEAECELLRQENSQLRLRIGETPVIRDPQAERSLPSKEEKPRPSGAVTIDSRPEFKVSLFRSLFRGRDDVYAVRWEGKKRQDGLLTGGIRNGTSRPSPGRGREEVLSHQQAIFN